MLGMINKLVQLSGDVDQAERRVARGSAGLAAQTANPETAANNSKKRVVQRVD
jgi:hypothetical protein